MTKIRHHLYTLLICSIIAMVTASCGRETKSRRSIAVSIPPQKALLEAIVGDSIDVVSLLRADSNPETFEITVADMRDVYASDAFFAIGNLPFESAVLGRIEATAPDMKVADTSRGIELIHGTHSHLDGGAHDGCESHAHGGADPHTWSSVKNLKTIASNMLAEVVEIDPANAGYYRNNYAALAARLDSLDVSWTSRLAPLQGEAFLVWHPSLSYFARDYGLDQIAVGAENKESSVRQTRDVLSEAAGASVRAFFIQGTFDSGQADNLTSHLSLQPTLINPLAADWQGELEKVVDALTANTTEP